MMCFKSKKSKCRYWNDGLCFYYNGLCRLYVYGVKDCPVWVKR